MEAFAKAEKAKKLSVDHMFTDVYSEMPYHLKQQMASMKEHTEKFKEHYPFDAFEKWRYLLSFNSRIIFLRKSNITLMSAS